MNNKILAVVGPTASGKSDLAVALAKRFDGEIVSCDSMQIYKRMDIGTAKPTTEEMDGIPHHLVDFLQLGTDYSVSDYVRDAQDCCSDIMRRGKLPILCGGTGLYVTSFVQGLTFDDFENDEKVHQRLQNELEQNGIQSIYERLKCVDEQSANSIDINNTKRVLRALEVYETTGKSASEWNRLSKENAKKKDCLVIGLDYSDRELLYERINMRVDAMLDMGLVDEARGLVRDGLMNTKTASQAIAYKEFLPYFNGEASLEECVEILKRNSRRYAKRQLTWFRRNDNIMWIFRDNLSKDKVIEIAVNMAEEYLSEE